MQIAIHQALSDFVSSYSRAEALDLSMIMKSDDLPYVHSLSGDGTDAMNTECVDIRVPSIRQENI